MSEVLCSWMGAGWTGASWWTGGCSGSVPAGRMLIYLSAILYTQVPDITYLVIDIGRSLVLSAEVTI
jgi:hypothetical protein